ncbi:Uncharacterized protein QTN25_005626 [Entamoeba marina]
MKIKTISIRSSSHNSITMFLLLITLLSIGKAQDLWIEWGNILELRCKENIPNENDCDVIQDAFEDVLQKAAAGTVYETHIPLSNLYILTRTTPYIMFGERIVDLALSTAINKGVSEQIIIETIQKEVISWLMKTARQEAGDFLVMMKNDDFWIRDDVKEYLKTIRSIDIDELRETDDEELRKSNSQDFNNKNENLNKNEL